ncbi:MAG: two-component system chemotaxis response regulator CheY [Sphingobacteriales bacterium]|jgi:two-component system chemotaxis response regulator CheY
MSAQCLCGSIAKKKGVLILLYINMPVLNGWDFLSEYIKIKLAISEFEKVVMLTSSNYPKDMDKAKLFPEVEYFIIKPLNLDQVKTLLNKYNI